MGEDGQGSEIHIDDTRQKELMMSRRQAVVTTAKIGAAMAATALVGNEAIKPFLGIQTSEGTFYPTYEVHEKGITSEAIPDNVNLHFIEVKLGKGAFAISPQEILIGGSVTQESADEVTNNGKLLPDELLQRLARSDIGTVFGDVTVPDFPYDDVQLVESLAGLGIVGGALGVAVAQYLSDYETSIGKPKPISRRGFLKGAAVGVTALAVGGGRPTQALAQWSIDKQAAIARILTRINGIQSNFHPENAKIFFRNSIMADKMLIVAQDFEARTGRHAVMSFNTGVNHSGIEDFLQAGSDFCRFLINNYPSSFMQQTIEANSSVEDFCSARVLKIPNGFTSITEEHRLTMPVEDRRVVDEKLQKMLENKLGTE